MSTKDELDLLLKTRGDDEFLAAVKSYKTTILSENATEQEKKDANRLLLLAMADMDKWKGAIKGKKMKNFREGEEIGLGNAKIIPGAGPRAQKKLGGVASQSPVGMALASPDTPLGEGPGERPRYRSLEPQSEALSAPGEGVQTKDIQPGVKSAGGVRPAIGELTEVAKPPQGLPQEGEEIIHDPQAQAPLDIKQKLVEPWNPDYGVLGFKQEHWDHPDLAPYRPHASKFLNDLVEGKHPDQAKYEGPQLEEIRGRTKVGKSLDRLFDLFSELKKHINT